MNQLMIKQTYLVAPIDVILTAETILKTLGFGLASGGAIGDVLGSV